MMPKLPGPVTAALSMVSLQAEVAGNTISVLAIGFVLLAAVYDGRYSAPTRRKFAARVW
jgi:hypothetical protein